MSKYTLKIDLPEFDQLLSEIRTEAQAKLIVLSRQFDIDRHTTLKEARCRQYNWYRDNVNPDLLELNDNE